MDNQHSNDMERLVSVIMPAYNCEAFIGMAMDSVRAQTCMNWELIVVDDCSTDATPRIVQDYAQKDPRIRCHQLAANQGAAAARNAATEMARGRYLAFLDSDDLWTPDKLEKQLAFMRENGYAFTCTGYGKIDESGSRLNQTVRAGAPRDYNGVLKSCPGNSTVMYDAGALGKFYSPDIRKRNDYALWLRVIRKAGLLHGLDEPLALHRVREGSLSKNKFSLIKYHWRVYRRFENLPFLRSCWLVLYITCKRLSRALTARG